MAIGRGTNQIKHLGDIAKIDGASIPPVDVITFGAPCQDLSIAGLRKGMLHKNNGDEETTRSGLFYEAIRVIKEMRDNHCGRMFTKFFSGLVKNESIY